MFMDKLAAQRKETREAMKALREEQDSIRSSIQEELQAEMEKIAEKNAKYKVELRLLILRPEKVRDSRGSTEVREFSISSLKLCLAYRNKGG